MQLLLLASLLSLLCVGWAEAFEVHVECKDGKQGGISCTKATVEKDPCLAKMEAAMRAIEPWHWRFAGGGKVNTPEESAQSDKAHRLWDATKRDCWQSGR